MPRKYVMARAEGAVMCNNQACDLDHRA